MLFRILAVLSIICMFGSIGSGDMGIYGVFRACIQAVFFLALAFVFHIAAEAWEYYRLENSAKRKKS